ncbi:MAG TPA: hypothetical protein PKA02_01275 [Candidatus Saccharibacteria bacterium]|jgi:hypothetical protein|nr:hypothetical protein [Candidatus Saccharibacteria bacterium]
MTINGPVGMSPEALHEAYLPFPVAHGQDIIADVHYGGLAPQDAALSIQNGRMPTGAGIVTIDDRFAAFDHVVATRLDKTRLEVAPSAKQAVDGVSDVILDAGLVMLTQLDRQGGGSITPYALAMSAEQAAWHDVDMGTLRYSKDGKIALVLFGIDAPVYDLHDIDSANGSIVARAQRRYF